MDNFSTEQILMEKFEALERQAAQTRPSAWQAALPGDFDASMAAMDASRVNPAARPLASARPVIGPVIVFCKRVVRRLLGWYLGPVADQQTGFNTASTVATVRLGEAVRKQAEQLEYLYASLAQAHSTIGRLEARLAELEKKEGEK